MNSLVRATACALLAGACLHCGWAYATPIPAAQFYYDVFDGLNVVAGCAPVLTGSANGGACGSETSGPGYAATSGGIGTLSYLPVTPNGTVLGNGTAVDATSTWSSGAFVGSSATMVYSFEATGPSDVNFIPIDVFSTGLVSASGDAASYVSLVLWDAGSDANIPAGLSDPDPSGPLLSLSAYCADGSCLGSWGSSGQQLTNMLCVVNGANYEIAITATTLAGPGPKGTNNSASAMLDPYVKLDPPIPASCPVASLDNLDLETGPGASTGFVLPEPSTFSLAAFAFAGLGILHSRRRRRPTR